MPKVPVWTMKVQYRKTMSCPVPVEWRYNQRFRLNHSSINKAITAMSPITMG